MDKTAARFPMCFVVPSIFCRSRRFDLVRRSFLDMPPRNFFRRLRALHESSQQVMDSDPRSFAEGLQANFEIRKLLVALLPSMQTDIFSAVSSMSPLGLNVLTNPESAYSAINLTIESRCNPKLR